LGGGLGYYSKAFEEAGFSVVLVEQDPVLAKFAREVLEVENLEEKSNEEFFRNNQKKFDIVFLRHVIEHSTSPGTLLNEVKNCLTDGGILIIETDNNEGIELLFRPRTARFYLNLYRSSFLPCSYFSLMKKRPFAVDPPRHLYGFRISNLSEMLRKNSLVPIETKCYRLGHPIYWPNIPLPTWGDIFSDIRHLDIKQFTINLIDISLHPFRIFLESAGLSSGICIYAIKDTFGLIKAKHPNA
jgi:SAM-dependent methyltransferase